MSPSVHPMAPGRILSQICFGSPLNIAASLAHPALPRMAVRGVYSPALLLPVAEVMQAIGYTDAVVIYGGINELSFVPEDLGLVTHDRHFLAADPDREIAAKKMYSLLAGRGDSARSDAVILNSALIFYVEGSVVTIEAGIDRAREILLSSGALAALQRWVEMQNSDPAAGLKKLGYLAKADSWSFSVALKSMKRLIQTC
jgi:anthranilate phosphoribosyltransferase